MKKLLFVFVFAVSLSTFASEEKPVKNTDLRAGIAKLLSKATFSIDEDATAVVSFIINTKGEIIVLLVDSKNEYIGGYIKSRLNYHVVTKEANLKGKVYKMPVKIIKE